MINAPHDVGQDWDALLQQLRIRVLNKLNRTLKINFEDCIEEEFVVTPPVIADKTASFTGALYGSRITVWLPFCVIPIFHVKFQTCIFVRKCTSRGRNPLCLLSAKIVDLVKYP